MIRTKLTVLAVVAGMLVGSAAFAQLPAPLTGLTVNSPLYSLDIDEFGGPGQGKITQSATVGGASFAYSGEVLYKLPQMSVFATDAQGNKTGSSLTGLFWGVCIDTHELSNDPQGAYLKQGWATSHSALGAGGRLNGTVFDQIAWNHTTYLFSQYGATIGLALADGGMSNVQKAAFQLATWEVMSGDGSGGANWGSGKFTAEYVTGGLLSEANTYVTAAYNAGFSQWTPELANGSFYFSGVKNNNTYQDYLVYAPVPKETMLPVPEIPAVALGPLGLMALGLLKRRFVK